MQRQDALLLNVFDWNKAHIGTRYRLGISRIIFVCLEVRFYELWRHQLDRVAHALKFSGPVILETAVHYS